MRKKSKENRKGNPINTVLLFAVWVCCPITAEDFCYELQIFKRLRKKKSSYIKLELELAISTS